MPPKTFAQGGAIGHRAKRGRAMDRLGDHCGIILQKGERLLLGCLAPHELADGSQPVAPVGQGDFTGFFQGFAGVLLGQREQPLQYPRPCDAAGVQHRLRPLPRSRPLIFCRAMCWACVLNRPCS